MHITWPWQQYLILYNLILYDLNEFQMNDSKLIVFENVHLAIFIL